MRRIYSVLIWLYPRRYREEFGREIVNVIEQAADGRREPGKGVYALFVIAELFGLISGAAAEWMALLTIPRRTQDRVFGDQLEEAQRRVDFNLQKMTHAIANHDFTGARVVDRGFESARGAEKASGIVRAGMISIPEFLYGTAWKEERTAELVELALRAGFRGIDTANQRKHYFEAAVGQGIQVAYRDGVVTRDEL